MEELAIVGSVAAVTQLTGQATGLISKIIQAVKTARHNRVECDHLVLHVSTVHGVLSRLPRDAEVAPPLEMLKTTLQEAHDMVVACRNRGAARQFFGSRRHADCFNQVNARIASDVGILNLCLLGFIFRRHANQVLHPNHTGVPTAPSPGSSSGSLQTQLAVSHVSSISDNPRVLAWSEIAAATNFTVELGRGSSGRVYKGRLQFHDGPEVAVRVLEKHGRLDVEDAFMAERYILSRLRHDNIVRLVGWCAEKEYRMLVYEHVSNRTLKDHLQRVGGGSSSSPVTVTWRARVGVLLGASRAIQYLHCGAEPLVIHRNVSSSNILLDANMAPRLSGFGSAVFQAACEEHGGQLVEEVVGTPGYIDPEYRRTKRVSTASDVYSFGVVMLEALTGRPPVRGSWEKGEDAETLVDSVLPTIRNGKLSDVLDSRLPQHASKCLALEIVADTAKRCLSQSRMDRPAISKVVANLHKALEMIASHEPMSRHA